MESRVDLSDIFNKFGSNKDRDGCTQVYNTLFYHKIDDHLNLLEIGIGCNNTKNILGAWVEFFSNAHIIGIDIAQNVLSDDNERMESHLCDSTKSEDVSDFIAKINVNKLDIIIDDGSQHHMDQIQSLRNFYPHLKDGGIYIIQNITNKLIECPGLIGCVCNHDSYFFTGLKNHMCVIYKTHINTKRTTY